MLVYVGCQTSTGYRQFLHFVYCCFAGFGVIVQVNAPILKLEFYKVLTGFVG